MKIVARTWNSQVVSAIRNVVDRRIVETASALYGAQAVNYVLPMLMIPYLARVLGPEGWGMVVFIQAVGGYLAMVISYSFDQSASREVARHREETTELASLVANVLGAKMILAAFCVVVIAFGQLLLPSLRDTGWLLWLGVFWFASSSLTPFWFFLGLEQVRQLLLVQVVMKTLAVVAIIIFVNTPTDAWRVLALQGAATMVSTSVAMVMVYRKVPFLSPSLSGARVVLQDGFHLFVLYMSTSLYAMSNTMILGLVQSSAIVGLYAGAERINGAVRGLMGPAVQSMFPRASSLARGDLGASARLARTSTLSIFALATLGAATLYFSAPYIIRIALGPDYSESVPVLRVLLLTLPIIGISFPLSAHWCVPMGWESLLTKIALSAGILHIPLAIALGHQYAQIGVAWSLVFSEIYMLAVLLTVLIYKRRDPFRQGSVMSLELVGSSIR